MKKYVLILFFVFSGVKAAEAEKEPLTPQEKKEMEEAYTGAQEDGERQIYCLMNKQDVPVIVLLETGSYQQQYLEPGGCTEAPIIPNTIHFINVTKETKKEEKRKVNSLIRHLINSQRWPTVPQFLNPIFRCRITDASALQKCYIMLQDNRIVPQKASLAKKAFCQNTNEHGWSLKFNIEEEQLTDQGRVIW